MRYERRESRQEDVREINELKERCEAQERDLCRLTEALRNLQMVQEAQLSVPNGVVVDAVGPESMTVPPLPPRPKQRKANAIPNCDVIYEVLEEQEEENEEQEEEEANSLASTESGSSTAESEAAKSGTAPHLQILAHQSQEV